MAVKSQNRTNVFINRNYIIRVYDLINDKCVLCSANTL